MNKLCKLLITIIWLMPVLVSGQTNVDLLTAQWITIDKPTHQLAQDWQQEQQQTDQARASF